MNRQQKNVLLSGGSSFWEVLKIALPLILSNSCHAVNMFVDRLMLARYSQEAVAASFTGGLTNFTFACLFVGTIGYTGTFVAQYAGARRFERIGSAVWQGIWLSLVGGVVMLSGIWWSRPLFARLKHDPAVLTQETLYFQLLCGGAFIFLFSCALSSFWTGRGKTVLVLGISFIITLLNLPFNYLLIYGKCGFPELGIAGAAYGTVLSELIGCVIYLVLFLTPSARRHFRTWEFKPAPELLKRMLRYGLPNGVHLALDLISFNIFSLLLGCYGVAIHEASSITFGINNIAFCPVIGIATTASILAARGIGAEDVGFAKRSVANCLWIVMCYNLAMVLLFSVFQSWVLAPFVRPGDAGQLEALRAARIMLFFISGYLLFDGMNLVFSNALRGAGDTRFPMWVMTIVGLFGFALPCLLLYCSGKPWWSLWISYDLEVILLSLIFVFRYLGGKWTKMRVIEFGVLNEAE